MEVPRARLTMELAKIKEANGEIAEAATVLQELQVLACCLLFYSLVSILICLNVFNFHL